MYVPTIFDTKHHNTYEDIKCENPTIQTFIDNFNTTIENKSDSPLELNQRLSQNLTQTKQYMDANMLALNPQKTKIFVITKNQA